MTEKENKKKNKKTNKKTNKTKRIETREWAIFEGDDFSRDFSAGVAVNLNLKCRR